jgi:hypothetical protein
LIDQTTMKPPSQQQSNSNSNSNSTYPTTLSNSILEALSSSSVESLAFRINATNTSPATEETVQECTRFRNMILESAMALLSGDDFDPIESPTTHQQQKQQKQ